MSGERDRRELLLNAAAEGSADGLNPRDYTEKLLAEAADGTDPRSNARTHTDLFINAISGGGGGEPLGPMEFNIAGLSNTPVEIPIGCDFPDTMDPDFSSSVSGFGYSQLQAEQPYEVYFDAPLYSVTVNEGVKTLRYFMEEDPVEGFPESEAIFSVEDGLLTLVSAYMKDGNRKEYVDFSDPNLPAVWTLYVTDFRPPYPVTAVRCRQQIINIGTDVVGFNVGQYLDRGAILQTDADVQQTIGSIGWANGEPAILVGSGIVEPGTLQISGQYAGYITFPTSSVASDIPYILAIMIPE